MKKMCSCIVVLSMLLTGCTGLVDKEAVSNAIDEGDGSNKADTSNTQEASNHDSQQLDEKAGSILDNLLPDTIGYGWRYYGSVEYGRSESIVEVKQLDHEKHIIVQGAIDDMGGGEMGRDYNFTKTYKVVEDGIILNHQDSSGETEFYWIKEPIEVGNTWEHPWYEDSTGKSEIVKADEQNIVVRTERLEPNPLQSYNITESVMTITRGIGIMKEELVMEGFDFSAGLDSYGERIFDWLGYYEFESNDDQSGYVTIYKMNKNEIAFDLFSMKGVEFENETGMQKIGKIEGNRAVFKEEIPLGDGSKSTYTVQVVLEKIGDTIQVTTDNVTPDYSGSDLIIDGIYKKVSP